MIADFHRREQEFIEVSQSHSLRSFRSLRLSVVSFDHNHHTFNPPDSVDNATLFGTCINIINVSQCLQLVCFKKKSTTMINISHNTDGLTLADHFGWCWSETSSSAS